MKEQAACSEKLKVPALTPVVSQQTWLNTVRVKTAPVAGEGRVEARPTGSGDRPRRRHSEEKVPPPRPGYLLPWSRRVLACR